MVLLVTGFGGDAVLACLIVSSPYFGLRVVKVLPREGVRLDLSFQVFFGVVKLHFCALQFSFLFADVIVGNVYVELTISETLFELSQF